MCCESRRGAQEVAGLLADLCSAVDATRRAITCHMEREEADVLPLLQARLCASQQRDMVWRTLCAMPLRLLERVLPWLAGGLPCLPVLPPMVARLRQHSSSASPSTVQLEVIGMATMQKEGLHVARLNGPRLCTKDFSGGRKSSWRWWPSAVVLIGKLCALLYVHGILILLRYK